MPRKKEKRYHYLYKTTNLINGKFYIGVHSTFNLNDGYLGSGKRLKYSINKYGRENFKIEILEFFENQIEKFQRESEIVNDKLLQDPLCMNLKYGGEGSFGYANVKDCNGNIFSVSVDDPKYLGGEYVGVNKGFITVKDIDNNYLRVSVEDPRYLNGELKTMTSEKIVVKDKNGDTLMVDKNDSKYYDYLPFNKNRITVKDKFGNFQNVDVNDPRYLSGELMSIWKNKKHKKETLIKMSEKAKNRIGNKNSQFGTCWIYNDNLKESKKIKKENIQSWLNNGWIKGRKGPLV